MWRRMLLEGACRPFCRWLAPGSLRWSIGVRVFGSDRGLKSVSSFPGVKHQISLEARLCLTPWLLYVTPPGSRHRFWKQLM